MRCLALLVLLTTLPSPTQATSVVIHKTATDIFVGADSKVIHPTGEADTLIDKIANVNGAWYVAAAGDLEIGFTFNVFRSAQLCPLVPSPSLTGNPTMREFADSYSNRIAQETHLPLGAIKQQRPDLYATYVANHAILELVFFGREDRQLKAYVRKIFPDPLLDGFTRIVPVDCEADCKGNIALGYFDVIAPMLAGHSPDYWKMGQEKAICSLITLEINKHPDIIGWPVKILRLTAGGTVG